MKSTLLAALLGLVTVSSGAETIHVDADPAHSTNTIRPTEALGAGVDRLPYGAADKLFNPATIQKILASGWQTVTYRQNTTLSSSTMPTSTVRLNRV